MVALSPPPILTIYRRSGCALCDEIDAVLIEILADRAALGLPVPAVAAVDVDADPATAAAYGGIVPVLAIAGTELPLVTSPRQARRFLARVLDGEA